MVYSAEISRRSPTCFIFLIDQSGSMEDPFGGDKTKKMADSVANAINKLLQNLVIKCAKGGEVRDYFHVGVIGYGYENNGVGPAFSGPLLGKDLVPISEIANNPSRIEERTKKIEDGAGGLVDQTIKFPIWFDSVAVNGTPMCKAFTYVMKILEDWLNEYPNSYPPIVINITDGESTDGTPLDISESIKSLSTSDGNVLLFNVHLSSHESNPILFADSSENLPDEYAKLLFEMSSTLPEYMQNVAKMEGHSISSSSRGFVFNADPVSVIQFLDIGTRPSNLR